MSEALTGQQEEQVKEWLNKHGLMRCRACDFSNVAPPTTITTLGSEANALRVVPLSCPYCGNTILLNAETVGLTP